MRRFVIFTSLLLMVPLAASAQTKAVYSWVDDEGVRHYGDSIPPEYAEKPKEVLNDQGVKVGHVEGKKTEEQLRAEAEAQRKAELAELQRRKDQSLLLTYQSVEEIEMHRDRRVELFQAQARVTELYLRNLNRRLGTLQREAGRFKPYSSNPEAPTVDPSLVDEIQETEGAISRHETNLASFRREEREIIERFDANITRFRELKGLTAGESQSRVEPTSFAQAVPE